MPNEACNTSIFFQTVNTWGLFRSENQSQLKTVRWNRDWCRPFFWVFLRESWRRSRRNSSQSERSEIWIGWILLCWLKSPASRRRNGLISLCKFVLSDQGEGKKKPSGNNQSPSVGSFSFSHSFFLCMGGGCWHGVWATHNTGWGGVRLDTSAAPEIPQLRPCRGRRDRLLHLFTSDLCLFWPPQEATIGSDCGCQQNCERTALNCWRIRTQWRAMMYLSPLLYKVLKPFFMGSLLHLHLLYCVSLVLFYVCASFWSVFSSFVTFLFWCGLEKPCFVFWSNELSVSKLNLSLLPVLGIDYVCVYIKSLVLLHVLSVTFVQGKHQHQCSY